MDATPTRYCKLYEVKPIVWHYFARICFIYVAQCRYEFLSRESCEFYRLSEGFNSVNSGYRYICFFLFYLCYVTERCNST